MLFSGLDCTLHAGRWLYLAGANGAGKTSLLRMVCGLSPVEAGQIRWNDIPIGQQAQAYRRELFYLGHLNALQESLSVLENLTFLSLLAGTRPTSATLLAALARFGLHSRQHQLVRHLSQGQKRRVALARLLLTDARLWLLDEPFVAMDADGIDLLAGLIAAHLQAGGLAVLTSHQTVDIGGIPAQRLELVA